LCYLEGDAKSAPSSAGLSAAGFVRTIPRIGSPSPKSARSWANAKSSSPATRHFEKPLIAPPAILFFAAGVRPAEMKRLCP
jgi:hypothetical protein